MPVLPDTQLSWQIDTRGRLVEPEEFGNIIRTGKNSTKLRLRDVARIELGGKDYSVATRFNGVTSAMDAVYLLPGANAIATGERVKARIDEITRTMPVGMKCSVVVDNNDFVLESIREVIQTLLEALLLVIIVVYVFLQNWRATLIPCLAMPSRSSAHSHCFTHLVFLSTRSPFLPWSWPSDLWLTMPSWCLKMWSGLWPTSTWRRWRPRQWGCRK